MQKGLNALISGRCQCRDRPIEDLLSSVDHDQVIGHLIRRLDVVCDNDLSDMLLTVQPADQLLNNVRIDRVQPGCRFIIENQPGVTRQRARNRHPFFMPPLSSPGMASAMSSSPTKCRLSAI